MALGSEESVRNQAKRTLKGDQKQKESGRFDKHSFQDFT